MKSKISLLTVLIIGLIAFCGFATALPITLEEVKVNGDVVSQSSANKVYDFEKDQELEVKVRVSATSNVDDVQIEASLRGYDHDDLMEDITDVFDMKSGVTYTKKLNIPLRLRMDQDRYKLRIRVDDRDGNTTQYDFDLEVDTERHSLLIKDVILSPENEVKAGRALLAAVRIANYGEKDEEGIRVKVGIPDLGVSATDYIDEIEKEGADDDQTTSEELYLRIPETAETGDYILRVEVTYDDGDEKEVKEMNIKVIGYCDIPGVDCAKKAEEKEKTIIEIAAGAQVACAGCGEAVYPITIKNEGVSSKIYEVSSSGADWATFRIDPSNVFVLDSGESKAVSVYVSAGDNAPEGQQTFTVSIKSGDKVLKEIPMKINVTESEESTWSKLKRGLEVALVVIVVLLVILGLIIGFNKLKGDDNDDKEEGETYY